MKLSPDTGFHGRRSYPDVDRACTVWLMERNPDYAAIREARAAGNLHEMCRISARNDPQFLEGFETEPNDDDSLSD